MNWFQSFVRCPVVVEALSLPEDVVESNRRQSEYLPINHIGVRNRHGANVCERREDDDEKDNEEDAVLLWHNCRTGADMVGGQADVDGRCAELT
ncbi:uncharacterized protein SPSK_06784 [Sporothrix schenckii 1099-18]|uniref:Uncharacterized protein n=1 Tax=Sporothrix schenckii 1099-18 TaxID=1397361 RepID=A0A0F2MKJ5_SPOSC|nr:uncharacterized protein SPSK_06784 [Sporothrix schenckii 1099-18]KJR89355.1 hypothetical protein SPSK_06784 [Sporothrix schenckii 1099-18]